MSWSDYRNGDVDIFVASSADRGRSWSSPVRVNSDALHNGLDQFFQWLAVDPTTGAVNVIFYDRRADPHNRTPTIVLARSTDQGRTFTNYAWSDSPFDPTGEFLGDYTGIAALNGRVYGVWTEKGSSATANGVGSRVGRTVVKVGVAEFR
jgi:hypothetical protein